MNPTITNSETITIVNIIVSPSFILNAIKHIDKAHIKELTNMLAIFNFGRFSWEIGLNLFSTGQKKETIRTIKGIKITYTIAEILLAI
jgi:hypothetical protein